MSTIHKPHRRYGRKPDTPDSRDYPMVVRRTTKLPASVSHLALLPSPLDQGNLGSCVDNSFAHGWYALLKKEGLSAWILSRLALYRDTREIEGTINEDAGSMARDALKVLSKTGCAVETLWPYIISKFTEKPPQAYYDAAALHRCIQYMRVAKTVTAIQSALAAGYGVHIGMPVYESFESDAVAKTGRVPMPKPGEKEVGGHETYLYGYQKSGFLGRNSWGTWGRNGNYTLPYAYIEKYDCDLWAMEMVK